MSRSPRCSKHCAAPRTLLSSNPALGIFAALFLLGALFFAAGTWLARRERVAPVSLPVAPITWTQAVANSDETFAPQLRLDMIERLAMVGQEWCVEVLQRARIEETDPAIADAIERALIVIGARR